MRRPIPFPAVAAAAYAAVVVHAARPMVPEGVILCPFRLLTGVPCPGCGMLHSLSAAMRGDLAGSFAHHPLGIPLLALWTAWLAWGALNLARGREFSRDFLPPLRRPAFSWAALALVFAAYSLRT